MKIFYRLSLFCLFLLGMKNAKAQAQISIDFSNERGFYTENFDLVINISGFDVSVKYTIDGSEPNENYGISPINSNAFAILDVSNTIVVRVYAYNNEESVLKTHTYIFVDDVFSQNNNTIINSLAYPSQWGYGPQSEPGLPFNSQIADYDMKIDTCLTKIPNFEQKLLDGLMEIPTMAISIEKNQIFGQDSGIYIYPLEETVDNYTLPPNVSSWERKASIEIFNDVREQDTLQIQVNAGLQISGASTRNFDFYKHSFKLKFRSKYGAGKLKYPLYGAEAIKKYDKLQLRMVGHSSPHDWSSTHRKETQLHKDSWAKHLQKKLSGYGSAPTSRFFHLFINGIYWGIYDVTERPDDDYMADYFGGNTEDYDIIKVKEVKNGTDSVYNYMYDLAHSIYDTQYSLVANSNELKNVYEEIGTMLDITKFTDYILQNIYLVNMDWINNNWWAARNNKQNGKFQFFVWDAEIILNDAGISNSRIIKAGIDNAMYKYHPIDLHQRLLEIPEYQMKFVDNIQCRCIEEDGILNPENLVESYKLFEQKIHNASLLEFARWGDVRSTYYAYEPICHNVITKTLQEYETEKFPYLLDKMLEFYGNQKTFALFPRYIVKEWSSDIRKYVYKDVFNFKAVQFSKLGGEVANGYQLKLTNPNTKYNNNNQLIPAGDIYYTTDGSEPRNIDGTVSASAIKYTSPIIIDKYMMIKARVFENSLDYTLRGANYTINNCWSAMCPREFFPIGYYDDLVINEIHYHPADIGTVSGSNLEFLEIKNTGQSELNITNIKFTEGIKYQFPVGAKIASNAYILLASNAVAVENYYNTTVDGEYQGKLDNGGELIELSRPDGVKINAVDYDDSWDIRTDGGGASLSLLLEKNKKENNHLAENWAGSANGYTPKSENLFCLPYTFEFKTFKPSCYGGSDGFINLQITGGTGNLSFLWSNNSTSNLISGLTSGVYEVEITDAQKCVETLSTILPDTSPIVSNLQITHASTANSIDGFATVNPNNLPNDYTVTWSDGSTGTSNYNLSIANNYWVTITSNNNTTCSITESFSIEEASSCNMPFSFSATSTSSKSALISWSGNTTTNTDYLISYKASNEVNWNTITTALPSILLKNLQPCTYYTYKVSANCNTISSNTSVAQTFVTSNCTNICNGSDVIGKTINITNYSAFILWDIVSNAKYRLHYRKNGFSTWHQYDTPYNFSILFGLDNCSNYEWYVSVICPNGTVSSNEVNNFTTSNCLKKVKEIFDSKDALVNSFNFKLYPNPAQNFIEVTSNYSELAIEAQISVFDISGRMVKDSTKFIKQTTLQIEDLQSGIYVAQIVCNKQNFQYLFRKE